MALAEGMRVYFDDDGPIYLCVGRDDENFYFQDENGMQTFNVLFPAA